MAWCRQETSHYLIRQWHHMAWQCATFPIDRGPDLVKNWVGVGKLSNLVARRSIHGDFICFTLWHHSRSIRIYCWSMVEHLNPRPVVYGFCKHYFAHCMTGPQRVTNNIHLINLSASVLCGLIMLTQFLPSSCQFINPTPVGSGQVRIGTGHIQGHDLF